MAVEIDDETGRKIIEMYTKHKIALHDIAKQLFNRVYLYVEVRKYLESHGIPKMKGHRHIIANKISSDQIQKYLDQGLKYKQICEILDISKDTLAAILKKDGKSPSISWKERKNIIKENEQDIIAMFEAGEKMADIAKKYGFKTHSSITKLLDDRGYKRRRNSNTKISTDTVEYIRRLYEVEKWSIRKISEHLNFKSPNTMNNVFKKYKIPRRSWSECSKLLFLDDEHHKKVMYTRNAGKKYILPSGREIILRGYEPQFLDYIFKNNLLQEDEINYKPNTIRYVNGKSHRYYPDFYIGKLNLIVEIKSVFTMKFAAPGELDAKECAARSNGFNFIMVLDNDFTEITEIIKNFNSSSFLTSEGI